MCNNLNLSQLMEEPTRPNLKDPSKSTLTDFILSNRRDKITASGVFALGCSDHCPLACVRSSKQERSTSRIVIKRNLKSFNEQAFLNDLTDSNIYHTSEMLDIELALEYFTKSFITIIDKHAPLKKLRIKNRSSPWFSTDLSIMFQERDKAWLQQGVLVTQHIG